MEAMNANNTRVASATVVDDLELYLGEAADEPRNLGGVQGTASVTALEWRQP